MFATHSRKAIKKIICFIAALGLIILPVSTMPFFIPAAALGVSGVGTVQEFVSALSNPLIAEIHITANIDASSINWNSVQKGEKNINGAGFILKLPATLSCAGPLEFRDIGLDKPLAGHTLIFANSYPFKLGTGVSMSEAFIKAIFGGSDNANSGAVDIALESGMIEAVYMGAYNGIVNGGAKITVGSNAHVGAIHAAYTGSVINGSSVLTLKGFGRADSYISSIPKATGFDEIILDESFIRFASWPAWLDAGQVSVLQNSSIWFDGGMALRSRLHGVNAGLIIADGSVISLPSLPDAVTGRFDTVISSGSGAGFVRIENGVSFTDCFAVAEGNYHKAASENNLDIHYISLNRIEILPPNKISYLTGDALDLTGGIIRRIYNPAALNFSIDAPLSAGVVTGFDSTRAGKQELTVTYDGKIASFAVWVADSDIISRALFSLPRTSYYLGETLDTGGGYIELRYKNGGRITIPFSDPAVEIAGFDTSNIGRLTLSVKHNGQPAGSYTITVRDRDSASGYYYDGEIDLYGIPYDDDDIEIGDSFTVTPSYTGGRWSWDSDYFDVVIDRYDMSATFTALKPGRTRIIFSGNEARADALIKITGTLDTDSQYDEPEDIPIPPFEDDVPLLQRPQGNGDTIVPPVIGAIVSSSQPPSPSSSTASSKVESAPKAESKSESSAVSESSASVSEAAVPAMARPQPAINSENLLIVAIGIAAAMLIAIATGIVIWRTARKTESY